MKHTYYNIMWCKNPECHLSETSHGNLRTYTLSLQVTNDHFVGWIQEINLGPFMQ